MVEFANFTPLTNLPFANESRIGTKDRIIVKRPENRDLSFMDHRYNAGRRNIMMNIIQVNEANIIFSKQFLEVALCFT